MQEWILTVG